MKDCSLCGVRKELSEFHKNNALSDGLTSRCKVCIKGYQAKRADKLRENKPSDWKKKTQDMKTYHREWKDKRPQYNTIKTKEWYEKNKDRMKVKYAVKYALKTGKLVKTPCVICGDENVEGHHPDYSLPLDVVWLCKKHHKEIHTK
jgi:hypothetical protein